MNKTRLSNTRSGRMRAALNRWWNTCQGLTLNQEEVDWRAPMESTHCTAPDCTRPIQRPTKGLCEMHYYRLRRNGSLDPKPRAEYAVKLPEECALDGCGDVAHRWANDLHVCQTHARRWARHGRFHTVRHTAPARATRQACSVCGCESQDDGPHGLCKMHKTRLDRHGDVSVAIPHAERVWAREETHPNWTGDDATYDAAHQRLRALRGSATQYRCDCGRPAQHWAYDHHDPSEKRQSLGGHMTPYSLNADHYIAMCVPCHKRYDLAMLVGAA